MSTHEPHKDGREQGGGGRWLCPICRQPVRRIPPMTWNRAWGARPDWSHQDGDPLCPIKVMGGGYKHASPVRTRGGGAR